MASPKTDVDSQSKSTVSNVNMKKLSDLRVIDLRNELERRGLDKSGNKSALIERLSKVLKESGQESYLFNIPSESPRRNVAKRTGTPIGKMTQKEIEEVDRDSDVSESVDGQDTSDSISHNEISDAQENYGSKTDYSETEKTGLEAADIVEDALQLEVDEDEFDEDRDEQVLDLSDTRKENKKAKGARKPKEKKEEIKDDNGPANSLSKFEIEPNAPTTEELDAHRPSDDKKDGESLINLDDTQSEIDCDFDGASNLSEAKVKDDKEDNGKDLEHKEKLGEEKDVHNDEREKKDGNGDKDSKELDVKTQGKSKSSPSRDSKSSSKEKRVTSSRSHSASSNNRDVWVSGLSSNTRASDLQALFKKYGKVSGAKIITNTRIPGSRCYGFITMETVEQAEKCIQHLNKTELHGRTIHLGKNRPSESNSSVIKSRSSNSTRKDSTKIKEKDKDKDKERERIKEKKEEKDKKDEREKEKDKIKEKKEDEKERKKEEEKKIDDKDKKDGSIMDIDLKSDDDTKTDTSETRKRDEDKKSRSKDRKSRDRSRSSDRRRKSLSPIRKFRRHPIRRIPLRRPGSGFLHARRGGIMRGSGPPGRPNPVMLRRMETERVMRRREREKEERRRIEMMRHQREMERKHQEEQDRLEREKEKLRVERERLEREKAELLKLEKVRFERERIEREREEMRRKTFVPPHRMDDRRPPVGKRGYEGRDPREVDPYWDDRKRISQRLDTSVTQRTFDPSGNSRFVDFDARNSHSNNGGGGGTGGGSGGSYERSEKYNRNKMESQSIVPREYEMRRDGRHSGHDRDDRRVGSSGGYYRESRNASGRGRDGRGRDDWKGQDRRERYMDKSMGSVASFGSNARYSAGSDRSDWSGTERTGPASSISKMYTTGSVVGETRSRTSQASMNNTPMMTSNSNMGGMFEGGSGVSMTGIMSHSGMNTNSGMSSEERSYIHSIRRF